MRQIGEKRGPEADVGYDQDMPAEPSRPSTRRPQQEMAGLIVLGLSFFTALLCLGFGVVWLLDESSEPGQWLILMPLLAVAALAASAFADTTWSVRATGTTELGNLTRLVAIGAVLVAVPSILIDLTDNPAPPRGRVRDACPANEVPDEVFSDVDPDGTHARAVNCLTWWNVVSDESDTFSPNSTVTRAQMATIVDRTTRAAGAPLPGTDESEFDDVADGTHAEAIGRVAAAGILGGTSETTFEPAEVLTRDQLATLVARLYDHIAGEPLSAVAGTEESFDDIADSVHADNIQAAASTGIVTGNDGSFNPGRPVTRAQMATMLARTLGLLVTQEVVELPD